MLSGRASDRVSGRVSGSVSGSGRVHIILLLHCISTPF